MEGGGRMSWEGISLVSVVLGFVGAALGVSYMPPMSKRSLFAALGAGVICAALAPGFAAEVWAWYRSTPMATPLPLAVTNVLAFISGVGGMFIVPTMILGFQWVQKNPLAILGWLRGRGGPPTPPTPPSGGAQ